jgi:general secretion pathway protein H
MIAAARSEGFTLIELLLVLSISALLLAMTPALLNKAFPVLKLKAAARDLVQEMRYLQNSAIVNDEVAEIRFDLVRGEYRSDRVNGGEVRVLPGGVKLSRESANWWRNVESDKARFVFYPDGSASGGVLFLANERQRLAIVVDWLTGRIQLNETQAAL